MTDPLVLFDSHRDGASFRFCDPREARCVALNRDERAVQAGSHAAGFLSYRITSMRKWGGIKLVE